MGHYTIIIIHSLVISLTLFSVDALSEERKPLNEYIRHYDGLTYDTEALHKSHHRARRSTDDHYVPVKFKALGREFHLRLKRDTSTFSRDLKIQMADGSLRDHDTSYIYDGFVKGDPNSRVHGSIINGIFAGRIRSSEGTFYVEKSEVYFREKQPFHSIIYHDKHIDTEPERFKRATDEGQCGSASADVHEWMRSVQNSAVHKQPLKRRAAPVVDKYTNPALKYSASQNIYSRQRRQTIGIDKTCTLFLQTDPMLWEYMRDKMNYGTVRTHEEITSLLAEHVSGIKDIYENTEFSSVHRGYSFVVRRIQIMDNDMCEDPNLLTKNRFCERNIDVTNFLNLNSLSSHDDYCLAYMFTYRDFIGGTLGLAWVAADSRAAGGICEKWKEYKENGQEIWKSLNTGIVTLVNYNVRVPPKVSTLTFAHEVGHNFGSPHDREAQCTPFTSNNDREGNYIMFASATSGDRSNNRKFSPCSKSSIADVLEAVVNERHGKDNCFVGMEEAFCGNGIVEEGEKCDCGYAEDCTDRCCYGRNSTANQNYQEELQCKLTPDASCSPTAGPCCTEGCSYVPAEDRMQCHEDTDCTEVSYCNGVNETCPTPEHKLNRTRCNGDTQICLSGECTGSVCSLIEFGAEGEWLQCFLEAPSGDKDYDKGNLCYVSCKNPDTGECVSSSPDDSALEKSENAAFRDLLRNITDDGIRLPPGAPCDNYKGYCDVFSKCRGVDADGPLAKLKRLFFSQETYDTVRKWVTVHWWAVMLGGLALVFLMGLFIWGCAVHTPSSNPNKKPARHLSDTIRRRPRNRAQGPPPGYGGSRPGGSAPSSRPPPYNNSRSHQYEMKPNRV